jgi:CBS domain containing-hemolysin-like protein
MAAEPEPVSALSVTGAGLLGLTATALNLLVTASQTCIPAIGQAAMEELQEKRQLPRHAERFPALEARLALLALLCLLTSAYFFTVAGAGLIPSSPSLGTVIGILTALGIHLIAIEVFARSIALSYPILVLRFVVPVTRVLSLIVLPFAAASALLAGKRTGVKTPLALADMHLRLLPSLRSVERILDEDAFEMIDSVREFADSTARDIMTPRVEVSGIPRNLPPDQVYQRLRESPYSRLVVYEGSLDRVVGTLLVKEVLLRRPPDPFIQLRAPIRANEGTRLPELLRIIRMNRSHLLLVTDEYGGLSGIVTLHDLFENIVGNIEDADDREELWIHKEDDGSYRLNGRVEIWEVNEELGLALDEDDARTLGGLLFLHLGRPARRGDVIRTPGAQFTVEATADNRVTVVHAQLVAAAEEVRT